MSDKIEGYKKVTTGFVTQIFVKQGKEFICTEQEFVASDQVDREDEFGNNVEHRLNPADEIYQPFEMVQPK
jgi:hypothetical protein